MTAIPIITRLMDFIYPRCTFCGKPATRKMIMLVIGETPTFCDEHDHRDCPEWASAKRLGELEYADLDQADLVRRCNEYVKKGDCTCETCFHAAWHLRPDKMECFRIVRNCKASCSDWKEKEKDKP